LNWCARKTELFTQATFDEAAVGSFDPTARKDNKFRRAEWQDYRRQVSAYELDRYLPVL
jgi:hypothetical protein